MEGCCLRASQPPDMDEAHAPTRGHPQSNYTAMLITCNAARYLCHACMPVPGLQGWMALASARYAQGSLSGGLQVSAAQYPAAFTATTRVALEAASEQRHAPQTLPCPPMPLIHSCHARIA